MFPNPCTVERFKNGSKVAEHLMAGAILAFQN